MSRFCVTLAPPTSSMIGEIYLIPVFSSDLRQIATTPRLMLVWPSIKEQGRIF